MSNSQIKKRRQRTEAELLEKNWKRKELRKRRQERDRLAQLEHRCSLDVVNGGCTENEASVRRREDELLQKVGE